ncbi:MAG: arsenic resistance N-acetyltransferase ArsN2 [Myxococcaceae bacterium]
MLPERRVLRPARPDDREGIEQLLIARGLPTAGAPAHLGAFVVAEEGSALVGCAGIERYGEVGLLRSVAVSEESAGRGLGTELVARSLELAGQLGLRALFLLTTTAADYFPRFGFQPIPRGALPTSLAQSEELRGACPATATAMRLLLPAR